MTNIFRRFILLVATMALLATAPGCSVSEKTCLQNDWQSLGYQHGKGGKSSDALNRYVKDCAEHGVTPDSSAYSAGFDVGIAEYCTAENGSKVGNNVKEYSGACPANLEKTFLKSYISGLRLAKEKLEIEYDRDTIELDRLRANRDRLAAAGESFARDDKRISSIANSISLNTDKRLTITNNISKWSGKL